MQNAFIKADRTGDAATHRSGRGAFIRSGAAEGRAIWAEGRHGAEWGVVRRGAADESGAEWGVAAAWQWTRAARQEASDMGRR